jgi:hypothetical protein
MPKLTRVISHLSRDVTRADVFLEMLRTPPQHIQKLADKNFALFKENPQYPYLGFRKKGAFIPPRSVAAIARSRASGKAVIIGSGSALTRIYNNFKL